MQRELVSMSGLLWPDTGMWWSQAAMRTLGDSELAISIYPTFSYNALGGGGLATCEQSGDVMHLTFDPRTVVIPDVNYR